MSGTALSLTALRDLGAQIALSPNQIFASCRTVVLMLSDEAWTGCWGGDNNSMSRSKVVNIATVSPAYSEALESAVRMAGGAFVEAPVSGSRTPAETGDLIGLLAGDDAPSTEVASLLAPACRTIFHCGPVPNGLRTKLAVNTFLISMVTGLAESFHFAQSCGLDLDMLARIIDEGPMASSVSRMKAGKLARGDLSVQASIANVLENARLVVEASRRSGAASPIFDVCLSLYREAAEACIGASDMIGVEQAIARRSPRFTRSIEWS